jgi:tetratricopeptide (TPR) repeat protein
VYGLGALLYLLLSGQHPVGEARRSPADLLRATVETEPPRVSDRAAEPKVRRLLRGDLDTIVAKALKKKPEERYASVTAFADDLRRHLGREPISARPDTLAYRTGKFVRRHTRGLATAGILILMLAGLVGFYTARLAKERDRARLEAEKAAKVSELLTGLLTGADPYATHEAKEPTVRGLLDAGATRIEKELAGQPELQAEMLTVMGRIYHRLDLDDKAQPLLDEAVAAGRRALGPEHERIAQSLNELGVLLRDKGNVAAAGPVLEEALAMRRKLLGNEHKDVAVTLVELGRVYGDQGNDQRAEALFRESLTIRRKALGEEDHETAVSLSDLAHVLRRRGDLAGAESLFRQALPIFRKTRGEDHPHVAAILNDLALIAADREDYPASEALFRQALAMDRKTLGEKHPDVASKLINLSRALLEQGKYEEAASVLQEGLQITQASLGGDHPLMAFGKIYLARVFLARNDPAAAEATRARLVALYEAWGRPEKAAPYRRAALR